LLCFSNSFYLLCLTIQTKQLKKIIAFVGFVLIISAGYFIYNNYYAGQDRDVWDFVPDNALIIYDTPNFGEVYKHFKEIEFGEGVSNLDLWDRVSQVFSPLDTGKYNSQFIEKIAKLRVLASVHSVAKEDIDFIHFIDISKENGALLQEYINDFINQSSSIQSIRVYNERNIFEVKGEVIQFSYFIEDGVLIVSQTPFLIEDVIRTISSADETSFAISHAKSIRANKLKNDQGDIYIATDMLNTFLRPFASRVDIGVLGNSTFLDVKISDDLLAMSGFTYSGKGNILNSMNTQNPVNISIKSYVPNTAYSVLHTGISNASTWYNELQKSEPADFLKNWDLERMTQWMGQELALIKLKVPNNNSQGKILIIATKDVNDALNQLNLLSEGISKQTQDTVFYDNYGGILIKELAVKDFPENLFGKKYNGFSVSYYAIIDNYVVLSSDIRSMHTLINSIEQEDTWGRTLVKSQWLSHTLEEASLSYFFDYSQADQVIKNELNETWKKKLQSNEQVMKGVGMGAIQFSNIDGQFYTNIMLQYNLERAIPVSLNFNTESTTFLEQSTINKPFVVRNHNLPQVREIVVQDSLKNIYLIDHKGAISWQDAIGQTIVGKVHQIDYYKNKKLQYLFAAGQLIYVLDRNGDDVENFPLDVGFEIKKLSVLDYDRTKNYRILVTDKKGDLHMYDKNGSNLEGWNPRKMVGSLTIAPRHIRVRGKDAIVAIQSNGQVNVMNRKGESLKGFPLILKSEISGEVHISIGRDFAHTLFSTISKEGELVQFDLNGEILNKKQFYKPTKDTFFELIDGVTKNDFVILRQNAFRLSLLNGREEIIIEKDYLTSNLRNVQYYDLGGSNSIYVVNDFVQGFGYIYNHEGKLLNNVPINNEYEIGLLKNSGQNKTYIYSTYEDQVNVYSF